MVFGMSTVAFTGLHVTISLVALAAGLIALYGMTQGRVSGSSTTLFLVTTALTSVTGLLFPYQHLDAARVVGIISLALLVAACLALYGFGLASAWRWIYAGVAVGALYLNAFVFVAQAFLKVPVLHSLAPKGSEPPFAIAQLLLLAIFCAGGIGAFRALRAAGSEGSRAALTPTPSKHAPDPAHET